MKITESYLKQLIKEELDKESDDTSGVRDVSHVRIAKARDTGESVQERAYRVNDELRRKLRHVHDFMADHSDIFSDPQYASTRTALYSRLENAIVDFLNDKEDDIE